jgi:NAD(P)-dependent dehydrogenase (short-subunit alcohol dehydrogenase family)
MTIASLAGKRVLIVGASAGIGRSCALQAIQAGAEVVVSARRQPQLDELVKEAGGGHAVAADLAKADDCKRIGTEAAGLLGTIDLAIFCAGLAPLKPIEEQTQDDWAGTFAVNVIGINLAIAALLPALAPRAIVAALSSESVGHPHWGLASYGASKAALEESMRYWRLEQPDFRFSTVPVGSTVPTEFGSNFGEATLLRAFEMWAASGLAQTELMNTDDLAGSILGILAGALPYPGVGMEHILLRSPSGHTSTTDSMTGAAADNGIIQQ